MEKLLGHLQPKLVAVGIAVEKDPRNFRSNKNLRERTTHLLQNCFRVQYLLSCRNQIKFMKRLKHKEMVWSELWGLINLFRTESDVFEAGFVVQKLYGPEMLKNEEFG